MTEATPEEAVSAATQVVGLAIKAASAYGRADLAARLSLLEHRLSHREVLVLVAGEYKQGKSSLVNALLGLEVCPVDDDAATAVPVIVRHAPALSATVVIAGDDGVDDRREQVPPAALRDWVLESEDDRAHVRTVELGVPSPLLAEGLALVDAPGAGGLGSANAPLLAIAPFVDAVLFVSDAGAELTASEVGFLKKIHAHCPLILVVESKIDMHPNWRRITELDGGHLASAGLAVAVLAASARLRQLAMDGEDDALDDESGVPVLLDWLLGEPGDSVADRGVAEAAAAVTEVTVLLRAQFEAERAALSDPLAFEQLVATVERASAEVNEARTAAGRWGQVLNDALSDFSSDVDHDLRDRIRNLCSASDAAIDAIDPATAWSEFERRLRADVAESIGGHCTWRHERLVACVGRVQAVFGAESDDIAQILAGSEMPTDEGERAPVQFEVQPTGLGAQGMLLLRSSVGGVTMFGIMGGLAGFAVAAPVMVGLGLMMGGKGLKDERKRQLAQRRAQAKASARRYLDEVSFLLGKGSRDAIRVVQRDLRDHFASRAEEVARGATAALAAAREAQGATGEGRTRRLADIEAELGRIDTLAERGSALTAAFQ